MLSNRQYTILGLKFLDIALLTMYYFIAGFFISTWLDNMLGKFDYDKEKRKSTLRIFLEIIIFMALILITFYVVRNIIEYIPFPFEGVAGFKQERVKERGGDVVFIFVLFMFLEYLTKKIDFLHDKIVSNPDNLLSPLHAPKIAKASPKFLLKNIHGLEYET
jgi:hypothetical protein